MSINTPEFDPLKIEPLSIDPANSFFLPAEVKYFMNACKDGYGTRIVFAILNLTLPCTKRPSRKPRWVVSDALWAEIPKDDIAIRLLRDEMHVLLQRERWHVASLPFDVLGNLVIRSIDTVSHLLPGTSNDCNNPIGN